jgi:ketosteroid isomerase-like protein
MSQENVEIVRRIYDAVARRDSDTPFELYAEDIVWDMSNARRAALFTRPVYHGHDGVRRAWREVLSAFGEVDFEVDELIDLGDQVLATLREREVGARAAPRSRRPTWRSGRWRAARSSSCRCLTTARRPLKPPVLGSRRCRGKTWA